MHNSWTTSPHKIDSKIFYLLNRSNLDNPLAAKETKKRVIEHNKQVGRYSHLSNKRGA